MGAMCRQVMQKLELQVFTAQEFYLQRLISSSSSLPGGRGGETTFQHSNLWLVLLATIHQH